MSCNLQPSLEGSAGVDASVEMTTEAPHAGPAGVEPVAQLGEVMPAVAQPTPEGQACVGEAAPATEEAPVAEPEAAAAQDTSVEEGAAAEPEAAAAGKDMAMEEEEEEEDAEEEATKQEAASQSEAAAMEVEAEKDNATEEAQQQPSAAAAKPKKTTRQARRGSTTHVAKASKESEGTPWWQQGATKKGADASRAQRIFAATNGHSITDVEAFNHFQSASEKEAANFPHVLASFHAWMKGDTSALKSADNYTTNLRMLMQYHRVSVEAMSSDEYFRKVRESKENARRNGIISASVKKFQSFVQQRGRSGEPWEARAVAGDARFKLGGARVSLLCLARPAGCGSLTSHFPKAPVDVDSESSQAPTPSSPDAAAEPAALDAAPEAAPAEAEEGEATAAGRKRPRPSAAKAKAKGKAKAKAKALAVSAGERAKAEGAAAAVEEEAIGAAAPAATVQAVPAAVSPVAAASPPPAVGDGTAAAGAANTTGSSLPGGSPQAAKCGNRAQAPAAAAGVAAQRGSSLQGLFTGKQQTSGPMTIEESDEEAAEEPAATVPATGSPSAEKPQDEAPMQDIELVANAAPSFSQASPLLNFDAQNGQLGKAQQAQAQAQLTGLFSKKKPAATSGPMEIDTDDDDVVISSSAPSTAASAAFLARLAPSPPGRPQANSQQAEETPVKTVHPVMDRRTPDKKLPAPGKEKALADLPAAQRAEIERMRQAVTVAARARDYSEAERKMRILQFRCAEFGCAVPPRMKERAQKEKEEKPEQAEGGEEPLDPDAEPADRLAFAKGILREKFPLARPSDDVIEDDAEIIPAEDKTGRGRRGRKEQVAADEENDAGCEERERAQAMKAAFSKIEDAPYEDLNRFPSVAATFRQFLEGEGREEAVVESEVRALHELFAQDEKSLPAMASKAYAEAVSGEPLHAQVVANFARFWKTHKSGPFVPAPPRAERGLEVRTRATHGIPLTWGVRVVQRTRKEDLVILTSPEGITRYAVASQLHNLPVMRSPEFVAERTRRKGLSEWEQQEELKQARPCSNTGGGGQEDKEAERSTNVKKRCGELEEGLKAMMCGGASAESRKKVLGVLFRQQVACARCGNSGAREGSGAEVDDNLVAEDAEKAEAAVERTKWTSYEDVPDATEEEKATYPAVLATFYQRGYPYLTGVRKLMELYKKRPVDMATPEFQRLVRHDPENAACNGFLNSAILYLRKFREEGGFEDLVDISTLDPAKVQGTFTPDYSRAWGKAQESFDDLQIEVSLEVLMADATQEWQKELQEKLDDDGYIQEDVDASGHRPVALSIALLPDATEEEWALWPRILARYEAAMKQASDEVKPVKREAEAAELFGALKELIEEHGKSPEAMASRKYVKMVRATYPMTREKAVAKFAEFWAAHKDEEFPEPKVHSLAANKYRLVERRLVEQARRLATEWKLPEGWAVRLGKDGRIMRITGPGRGEVFHSREAALEAVDAKSKKQAEEAKAAQKQMVKRQDARISATAAQASIQTRLREAIEKEDYAAARQLQSELQKVQADNTGAQGEDLARPCRAGTMPIKARDLQAPSGKGGGKGGGGKGGKKVLFAKRKAAEDANTTPLKVRKAQSLKQVQQQQAAACELTLRAREWRVLGVSAKGGPVLPLGSPELQGLRPEQATVVLVYVDEEVRERKRLRIVESWGLDETWTVTIRVRRSGDQITARRADGKVFFNRHELVCERQQALRQQLRTNAAECIKGITGFLSAAAGGEAVWELEAKGSSKLSGLYMRAVSIASGEEAYEKVKAINTYSASSSSGVMARRCGEGWEFVDMGSSEVLARTTEESLANPFDTRRLRLSAEESMDVRGTLLPPDQVGIRAAALLAQPRGPVCRLCESGRDSHGSHLSRESSKSIGVAKNAISRAERLAQYQVRLRELQARRAAAPRTLQDMVSRMLDKLRHHLNGQLPPALLSGKKLRIGTMCSGTDAPVLVANALQRVLGTSGISGLSFEHIFSCEQDAFKQEFLRANFPDCKLLFHDVCQLGRRNAYDVISRSAQPVPGELDVLLAGFSCKDLSMMNSYRKTLAEMGQSGSTLRGVLDYVERYRPRIVLLENVWAISKANSCGFRQVDLVMEGLKMRGYAAGYKLLNSCDYYVPQIRHRVWMWGIRLDNAPMGPGRESETMALSERASRMVEPRFQAILRDLEEPCALHFDDYMLDDDHPDVRAHFQMMSGKNRASVKQKRGKAKRDWTEKYTTHRASNDYQYERPYTAVRDAEFLQVLNEREKELLDLKCLDVLNEQGKDPRSYPMLWELSQSVERVPGTRVRADRQNYATCILPGMLWHSSRKRWVLGIEKLALQGVFAEDLKDTNFPQKLLGDLAGNAFTSTVCAVNLLTALTVADDVCSEAGA